LTSSVLLTKKSDLKRDAASAPTTLDHRLALGAEPLRAHLVGASGAGMLSLASVLAGRGWRLTASDAQLITPQLLGATRVRIAPGHSPRYLPASTELVIHSAAVGAENCELQREAQLGIPTASYPRMLGELQRGATGLAVAGTHGKTTTAALAAAILIRAGLDPTVVLGGVPVGWRSGGRPGRGPHVLVEACEYRSNFLQLRASAAVLLNIELDHLDYFRSLEHLESTFAEFVRRLPADGLLVTGDCARVRQISGEALCRIVTCGVAAGAAWRAVNVRAQRGRYSFEVWRHGRRFTEVRLAVGGRHQLDNSLAAIALTGELGVSPDVIKLAVEEFGGVSRRLEVVGTWGGVTVVDDYAHHPTAVRATLATVQAMFPGRPVWCVFEPHQVTRLAGLLDDFSASLHNAHRVLVTEVFCAREKESDSAGPARQLVWRLKSQGCAAEYTGSFDDVLVCLHEVRPGDIVLTMGAGEVGKIRDALVDRLRRNSATE
jgi:UDP-N-acetylmuramate--alanine ligase